MNTIGFSSFIDPQCMGIGVSFNELPDNEPQPYEVVVKDSNDWEEIHDYIINENEIDGIPNRKIECISSMNYSSEMSTYQMSNEEANILRNHPKVEYVEKSPLFNPVTLEKRKFYEQFDRYLDVNRFGIDIENKKDGTPGTALTFTQWGLLRHSKSSNPYPTGTASVNEDIQHSLTGKNVDIVIMDNGVRWDHPEFLKPGYTSVPAGVSTASVSRVRDILIHGPEEAGTYNWNDYGIGLVKPGTGSLVGYTTSNVLESSTFNGIWHGSHVAGIAAGNQFGWAFESNIWSIACVDRSDVGFSDPFVGFDYIRVWHKNKPINPETGKKNPTILNGSWSTKNFALLNNLSTNTYYTYNAYFRGKLFTRIQVDSANDVVPALYYANIEELEISGNTWRGFRFPADAGIASRQRLEGLFNDPDCDDIICVFAAGNQGTKMDTIKDGIEGEDYGDNYFDLFTRFLQDAAKSNYYNRLPSPAFVTPIGREDAPIVVASLNNDVNTSVGEYRSSFSNIGPGVDIISAGSSVLGVSSTGYQDPRNSSFYIDYLSGTSMAAPQISGVLACYVQSQPKVTRVDARNWIFDQGSIVLPTDTGLFFDTYKDPVGVGSVNYWSNSFNLKGAEARILYNPTANNTIPSMTNLNLSGENLKYKHGFSFARPGGNYSDPLSIGTVTVSGPSSGTLNSNTSWSVSISGTLTDLSYTWSAGSGATITNGTTASPTISWSTGGTKTVTCTVTSASATDSPQSGSASITLTTTIGTVTVSGPSSATPNSNTSWSASISGDATDLSYTWSAGSDATITNGTTASPTISWSSTGSKTVTCTVTSASATDSPQSGSASISIATQFTLDLLIIGGGGGGGGSGDSDSSSRRLAGGGGGAGGVRVIDDHGINNGAFTVTIGAGGDGGDSGEGDSGGSTSIFGYTVTGGGGGGGDRNLATSGGADGSGGGGGGQYDSTITDRTAGGTGGTYGNDGGDGIINTGNSGGGGGGAGSAGADAYVDQDDSCFGGDGGSGYDLSDFSSLLSGYVAGGGGGGQGSPGAGAPINPTPGSGGSGGGGNGGNAANDGNNATGYGSGGGGAGRSRNNYVGGSGSGGVIYIKYSGSASVLSYTGSMTTTINSGTVIHRITSNGTLTKS